MEATACGHVVHCGRVFIEYTVADVRKGVVLQSGDFTRIANTSPQRKIEQLAKYYTDFIAIRK